MLNDSIMDGLVILTLGKRKLQETEGRWHGEDLTNVRYWSRQPATAKMWPTGAGWYPRCSRGDFYVNEDDYKHVDLPPNEIEKFQLAPGDLLACRFNGNLHYVGRFSYYSGESSKVQVNPDKLIRFRIKTKINCPRYVCLAMNAAPTREAIEGMCATTAGNIGLNAGRLNTVEIPLPPLAEQRQIVAKVEQLMALVDELDNNSPRPAPPPRTSSSP
jgi:hypothetical protein